MSQNLDDTTIDNLLRHHLHLTEVEFAGCLIEGSLAPSVQRTIDEHLATCDRCNAELMIAREALATCGFESHSDKPYGLGSHFLNTLSGVWDAFRFRPLQPARAGANLSNEAEAPCDSHLPLNGVEIDLADELDVAVLQDRVPWAASVVKIIRLNKETSHCIASVGCSATKGTQGVLRITLEDSEGRHSEVRLTAQYHTNEFPDRLGQDLVRIQVSLEG